MSFFSVMTDEITPNIPCSGNNASFIKAALVLQFIHLQP